MKPFKEGERLSAPRMNELRQVAEAKSHGSGYSGGDAPLLIKNGSGSDVALGQVLGISGLRTEFPDDLGTFLQQIVFTGATPVLATHEYKYAVALEPIADGAVGRCAVDGVVRVRLNVVDVDDLYAYVAGGAILESNWFGNARILAKEGTETGEQWAVLRLNDPSEMKFFGVTVSSISGGAMGSVKVYVDASNPLQRTTGEEGAAEDVEISVEHPTGSTIDAEQYVQCERLYSGSWIVDAQYC